MRYVTTSPSQAARVLALKRVETEAEAGTQTSFPEIAVVLESAEFVGNHAVRDDFRFPAFFWMPSDPRDRVPDHVATVMASPNCKGIIWLSKALVEGNEIHLCWVFAHELCHMLQMAGARQAVELGSELRRLHRERPHLQKGTQLDHADELDSEIFAKALVRKIYGPASFEAYIAEQRELPGGVAYHAHLEVLETTLFGAS